MKSQNPVQAGMRRHAPLLKVVFATLFSFGALAALRLSLGGFGPLTMPLVPVALGVLWGHLFEYGWHRVAQHENVRWLGRVRRTHLRHHARFHGERFTAERREDLEQIATSWLRFPAALALHFLVLVWLTPGPALVAFLGGGCLHYLLFEVSHWFMHVENSELDALIRRIPGLREVRRAQIEHHVRHHELPNTNFSFTPPFLGDELAGTRHRRAVVSDAIPAEPEREGWSVGLP